MADITSLVTGQEPEQPSLTPAEAEAAQPAPNERQLTPSEALAKASAAAIQERSGTLRGIIEPLPGITSQFSEARKAGYSWDEIYQGYNVGRAQAVAQGYTPHEVDQAVGIPTLDETPAGEGNRAALPPPSAFEENGIPGHIAGPLRDFAAKYLTPRDPAQAAIDFKPTAGGILKDLGWNVVDFGKTFGRSVVDGAAATAELLDGRKGRTIGDWARLGWEASGFLSLFLPGGKGGAVGETRAALPSKEDMVDAATVLHAKGGGELTDHMRTLGEHFVRTGEDPVEVAQNAQVDPDAMKAFNDRAEAARVAREGGINLESGYPNERAIEPGNGGLGALGEFHDYVTGQGFSQMMDDVRGIFQSTAATGRFNRLAEELPTSINSTHTIPYGAGISEDGRQVYIDRNLPESITVKRQDGTEAEMDPRKYLAVHEAIERHAIDTLGLQYPEAHERYGDGAEKAIIENDGWDWKDYNTKILAEISKLSTPEAATSVPTDLYEKPYIAEGQADLVERHGRGGPLERQEPQKLADAEGIPTIERAAEPEASETGILGQLAASKSGAVPMLSYPEIDAQSIRLPGNPLGHGLVDDLKRIFAPAGRAPEAAGVIREGLARDDLTVLRASNNLRRFGRAIGEMPSVDRRAWFDAYETGNLGQFEGTPAGAVAKVIHAQFDGLYARMEKLGIAPDYIENYIPHLWQDPEAARSFLTTRRPLEGAKRFTRSRSYELISDGLQAGLKLVTDDPVELSLLQIQQQSRFIAAHEITQGLVERGLATKVASGQDVKDLARINLAGGDYFAPEPVATLMNRLLSPGLSGRPVYDALRSTASAAAQSKLIGSVFHPMLLAWDAVAGQIGLGVRQIARGATGGGALDLARGVGNIGTSPAAPFINAYRGSKYISEAINGPGADPFRATVADAMISSGTRFASPGTYRTTASGSFLRVLKGTVAPTSGERTLGQETVQMFRDASPIKIGNTTVAPAYVRAMAQWAGRGIDTVSAPIMEVAVPHMKVGAIASEMEDMLRAHPNMTADDIRAAGGKIVDQIDNRLGEMTYDHLFWNKAIQDVNHVLFLAPGWALGKLRLMGGVGTDLLKGGVETLTADGEKELGRNISYLAGALGATAMVSSVYGYLHGSWNKDWGWRDYLFPPDKSGTRMSLPSIVRDVYGWSTDPAKEATNKLNPVWSTMQDLLTNRQYNGAAITDPRGPWLDQAEDYADFTAKQFAPLVSQKASGAAEELSPFERFLGIRPAPYSAREPEKEQRFEERDLKKAIRKKERMQ